jgi:nitrite reductase/ring-hydroxylating ferredoxin subunit
MAVRSVTVGKTTGISTGELAAFDVDGTRIAVANADGRFFAIDELCTHEQCSLAEEGTLEGTVVTCGCHGAQFDVTTGRVLAPPAFEPLNVYPLRVDGDDIVVDDVFAAGDVANHYHPLFQRRMRVEHWQNAIQQGAAAARSMLGHRVPYDAVHWFWSDQYDVNVQYAGVHGKWDQIVFRGAPATRSFLAFYLNGGRVDAIAGVNRGEDLRRALPLIRARSMVQPRQLADEDVDLRTLVRTETPDSHLSAARDSDH